jgi:hypothetical protein
LKTSLQQRTLDDDARGAGGGMITDFHGLLGSIDELRDLIPALEGALRRKDEPHAVHVRGTEHLHGCALIDAGHDSRARGQSQVHVALGEHGRGLRATLVDDDVKEGQGLVAVHELIFELVHHRTQMHSEIPEFFVLGHCRDERTVVRSEDVADVQNGKLIFSHGLACGQDLPP